MWALDGLSEAIGGYAHERAARAGLAKSPSAGKPRALGVTCCFGLQWPPPLLWKAPRLGMAQGGMQLPDGAGQRHRPSAKPSSRTHSTKSDAPPPPPASTE